MLEEAVAAQQDLAGGPAGNGREFDDRDAPSPRDNAGRGVDGILQDCRARIERGKEPLEIPFAQGGAERRGDRSGSDGEESRRQLGTLWKHDRDAITASNTQLIQRADGTHDLCP